MPRLLNFIERRNAFWAGRERKERLLLRIAAETEDADATEKADALEKAIKLKDWRVVELLFDVGEASATARGSDRSRPFVSAIISGNPDVVRLFIQNGAKVKRPDWSGLELAARVSEREGMSRVIDVLLEHVDEDDVDRAIAVIESKLKRPRVEAEKRHVFEAAEVLKKAARSGLGH